MIRSRLFYAFLFLPSFSWSVMTEDPNLSVQAKKRDSSYGQLIFGFFLSFPSKFFKMERERKQSDKCGWGKETV